MFVFLRQLALQLPAPAHSDRMPASFSTPEVLRGDKQARIWVRERKRERWEGGGEEREGGREMHGGERSKKER